MSILKQANLRDNVLDFFKSRQGSRITNYVAASAFDVPVKTMRELLNSMVSSGLILFEFNASGHGRQYYIPSDAEARKKNLSVFGGMKEYKPGPEWDSVYSRIEEFRSIKSKL